MAELIDRLSIRNKLYDADAITMRGVAMLNQEPSVDAVSVVRCKNCKHCCINGYGYWCDNENAPFFDNDVSRQMKPDDFCSYGERKEQADGTD